jgi:hypothetical protein
VAHELKKGQRKLLREIEVTLPNIIGIQDFDLIGNAPSMPEKAHESCDMILKPLEFSLI